MPIEIERLKAALADRYAIEREIGAGGMATVYVARDLRHDRNVAVKVLKPELAAVLGADRFVQEIRTTAKLQHPHILPLFDSGEADGFLYYVMPYIEGETLREKLSRDTQLGVEEALRIATEVADALDYAHRHGVIHRDIKPENILLHDGRPVVADFGIALAVSAAAGGRMTETGLSLGTPHYMSPEQATGEKELTNRSDIYSLASVLYEMLTGDPPHTGSSAQQIIMKIVTDEARPVTELRKAVPPNVAAATAKALAKLPADRFESAKALAEALKNRAFTHSAGLLPLATNHPEWRSVAISAVAIGAVAVAVAIWGWARDPVGADRPTGQVVKSVVGEARYVTWGNSTAISPDGQTIVFVGGQGLEQRLYRRRLDDLVPTPIEGTEGARTPFYSPDGEWIGFTRNWDIWKVRLSGGGVLPVVKSGVATGPGVSWGVDGWIYFMGMDAGNAIVRVSEAGGLIDTVMIPATDTSPRLVWLTPLPDGRSLIGHTQAASPRLAMLDIASGSVRIDSSEEVQRPHFVPPGTLVFGQSDGTLLASQLDVERGRMVGRAIPLAGGVEIVNDGPQFAVSRAGSIVYAADEGNELVWESLVDGTVQPATLERENFGPTADLSPDGSRIAVSVFEGLGQEIRLYDAAGRGQNLTQGEHARSPVWSPDGRWIAYGSWDRGIARLSASGAGESEFLTEGSGVWLPASWTPDGKRLAYTNENWESFLLDPATGASDRREGISGGHTVAYSPDGSLAAFQSDHRERLEVYVQGVQGGLPAGPLHRVSFSGGIAPHWSPDGNALYYVRWRNVDPLTAHLVLVDIVRSATIAAGTETVVADWSGQGIDSAYRFDIHPDGKTLVRVRSTSSRQLILLQNWLSLVTDSDDSSAIRR